ncbi:hypothetical protein [Sphingobium sp.]|uniref:hypothetical protein n=1 Tax=Sphingobium sp. TaxID=1912891 RepID=UPI003B3A946C
MDAWRKAVLLLSLAAVPLTLGALATLDPPRGIISDDRPMSASLLAFLRER